MNSITVVAPVPFFHMSMCFQSRWPSDMKHNRLLFKQHVPTTHVGCMAGAVGCFKDLCTRDAALEARRGVFGFKLWLISWKRSCRSRLPLICAQPCLVIVSKKLKFHHLDSLGQCLPTGWTGDPGWLLHQTANALTLCTWVNLAGR